MASVFLFDIDNTLLNTKKLTHEYIYPELSKKYGMSLEDFSKVREEYYQTISKPTMYDPEAFLDFVVSKLGGTKEELQPLFFKPDFFINSLFEDVIPTLLKLQAKNVQMGIFSEGNNRYQHQKLRLTGLEDFFQQNLIFISDEKLSQNSLVRLPIDALIVDDNPVVIEALTKLPTCQPIMINREEQPVETTAQIIRSLSELLALEFA